MISFHQSKASILIPDGVPVEQALSRTTDLAVGAHQDDLEFMALHPILECYQNPERWFTGVTVTDGRGSARTGPFAGMSDDQMREIRLKEQQEAARLGQYGAMICLDYPSVEIKSSSTEHLQKDLMKLFASTRPERVFTHNLADKHETHVAVVLSVIRTLRLIPASERPKKLYGCEVWRTLDWLLDSDKTIFDVSQHESLSTELMKLFDSQISGGKRYDLATLGRKRANATYLDSHSTDQFQLAEYAMDLTPLILEPFPDIFTYIQGFIRRFETDVKSKIDRYSG